MICQFCHSETKPFKLETFKCSSCGFVFKDPAHYLSKEEDFKRYSFHKNGERDVGYVNFLKKLTNPLKPFLPAEFSALDFGCGPGPTLSLILAELGGQVENYDPLFFPHHHLLCQESYDVVASTEVVEHFKEPRRDWDLLVSLVKPGGLLGIMTQMYSAGIDYEKWWYKNDPTHVAFYQKETFTAIERIYQLETIYTDDQSIIIFKKEE